MNSESDSKLDPITLTYANVKPKAKRNFLTVLLAVLAGLFGASFLMPLGPRSRTVSPKTGCRANLLGIGQAMYLYAQDEPDSAFPDDISKLILANNSIPKQYVCPVTRNPGTSYFYVAGLTTNSPASSVLMYENPLNHKEGGGNVLFVNGHVEYVNAARLQALIQQANSSQKTVLVPDLSSIQPPN